MAWNLSGQYMESCSCDYLCPCIYTNPQGPATQDHCTALMVFRIDEGIANGVDLAGCKFAFVIKTGPVMADGNWTFANVIDTASDEQASELEKIAGGTAGGTPQMIRDNLVTDYRGCIRQSIQVGLDGLSRRVEIPGVLSFDIQGVEPRNRPGEAMHLENTAHPANHRLALARTGEMRLAGFGLDESLVGQGNNGHFAPFSWKG